MFNFFVLLGKLIKKEFTVLLILVLYKVYLFLNPLRISLIFLLFLSSLAIDLQSNIKKNREALRNRLIKLL